MSYLDDVSFQYYPADITKCAPMGEVSLRSFIESHRTPNKDIEELFTQISKAASLGDLKKKNELKKGLYYFTPCVKVDKWRDYSNILSFSGLMQIDFDGIRHAEEFRDELFEKLGCVVCAYVSPSKLGMKALVRIPICKSVDEYKSYAYGLFHYLERYIGFDAATKNPILPLYLSIDPNIRSREDPFTWDLQGLQIDEFDMSKVDPDFEASEHLSEDDLRGVAKHIKNTISQADRHQVGHKYVVSGALLAGGYASMYSNINQDLMLDYIFRCIDESYYLQKDTSGYKKTATTMYKKGLLAPLEYDNK